MITGRSKQKISLEMIKKNRKKVVESYFGSGQLPNFSGKTSLQEPLENFSRIVWSCCRYVKGCPRVVLSNGKKLWSSSVCSTIFKWAWLSVFKILLIWLFMNFSFSILSRSSKIYFSTGDMCAYQKKRIHLQSDFLRLFSLSKLR